MPLSSQVSAVPVAVLSKSLQVGAFFSGSVSIAIPSLAAGALTTVSKSISFSSGFPAQVVLKAGQFAYILASAAQAAAVSGIIVGAPILQLASGPIFNGPTTVSNFGATLTAQVYSPGATSGETVTFNVFALLLGAWS